MTRKRAGQPRVRVSIFGRGKRFSLLQSVQACFGAHPVSYLFLSGVRRPGHEADHSNFEVNNEWNYTSTYSKKVVMVVMMMMMMMVIIIIIIIIIHYNPL